MSEQNGPQGAPEKSPADYVVTATVKVPAMEKEDVGAVQQLLASGLKAKVLKAIVKSQMVLRDCEDGSTEARVDFYAVPVPAMKELLGEKE